MPQATRTITVSTPPDQAFEFFTDPGNDMQWRIGVRDIEAGEAPRVGAVVRQTIAGPMGRGIKADIEITAYEPNTRYAFRAVEGPVRPVGSYTFAEVSGGTEVTFMLSAELTGLKKAFMGGQVQRSMDGEMAALDKAKALLEGTG